MTKYYYIPEQYKKDVYRYENGELKHFDFKFPDIKFPEIKIPEIKAPDIGKIIDDARKNLTKTLDDAGKNISKGLNDSFKNVSNAVSGTLGGLFGREWKNHKWIARKRNKDGKWIYDYGNGFPGENSVSGKNGSGGVSPDDIKLYEPSIAEKFLTPLVGLGKVLVGPSIEDSIRGGQEFIGGFVALGKRIHSNAEKEGTKTDSTGFRLKKSGDRGKDYDLANTNPEWDLKDGGSQSNCPCCSFAYDMRRRGYEVTAKQTRMGLPEGQIDDFYKNPDVKTVKPGNFNNSPNQTIQEYQASRSKALSKAVEEQFETEPDNSRGICWMTWNNGAGGHIVAYEKEDGVTKLYDAQSGEKLDIHEYVDNASDFSYYRTDNLEPNYDMMKKVVE